MTFIGLLIVLKTLNVVNTEYVKLDRFRNAALSGYVVFMNAVLSYS